MFEKYADPLSPFSKFLLRLCGSISLAFLIIFIALYIGMLGYHVFESMPWIDAFVNASMILSGMGPLQNLSTTHGKIFAGCYALFSGLVFISVLSIVFAPVLHRTLHKFHQEVKKSNTNLPS